jgi:hypothetical protein
MRSAAADCRPRAQGIVGVMTPRCRGGDGTARPAGHGRIASATTRAAAAEGLRPRPGRLLSPRPVSAAAARPLPAQPPEPGLSLRPRAPGLPRPWGLGARARPPAHRPGSRAARAPRRPGPPPLSRQRGPSPGGLAGAWQGQTPRWW